MRGNAKVLAAYGISKYGLEILHLGEQINSRNEIPWREFIFIDDDYRFKSADGYKVYSYHDAIANYGEKLEVIIAVKEPCERHLIMQKLHADHIAMPVLISPDAFVSEAVSIGQGSVVRFGSSVVYGAKIGKNVLIDSKTNVGCDSVIGEGSVIESCVNIGAGTSIGAYTYICRDVVSRTESKVGNNSVVNMGCLIREDIPSNSLATGDPIRTISIDDSFRVFSNENSSEYESWQRYAFERQIK